MDSEVVLMIDFKILFPWSGIHTGTPCQKDLELPGRRGVVWSHIAEVELVCAKTILLIDVLFIKPAVSSTVCSYTNSIKFIIGW